MLNLQEKLFEYLKKKIPNFTKVTKSGAYLFTCPNISNHKFQTQSPTATLINGTDKISCLICNWKGNIYDVIRILESDKKDKIDAELISYFIETNKLDLYSELDEYQKYGWNLIPVAKNSKNPIPKDWTKSEYKDKITWLQWLQNGLNIGVVCGKSNILVIDVDNKPTEKTEEREQLINLLNQSGTLIQETPSGGKHFVYLNDDEIPQQVNIGGLKIDTRCNGGQILIAPSRISNVEYRWQNLGQEIKKIPEEIKSNLLKYIKVDYGRNNDILIDEVITTVNITDAPKLKNNNLEGCCNDTFISMAGALINKLNPEQTEFVLNLMNRKLLENPMPDIAIKGMLNSVSGYKNSEDVTQEEAVYEYLKLIQTGTVKDVMEGTGLKRPIVDKYLSKFNKEGKAIRLTRGTYQYKERVEWSDEIPQLVDEYKYKIPFFNEIAIFQDRDALILGGKTNEGKTSVALNMLQVMINQGVKPYYIFSEAGSRWQKTAEILGIAGKFYHTFHENPLAIELEKNAFSIIDWLHLEHKENTDTVLKHLNNELQRKGGILVIFTQLKQDYSFFAPNLIDHYPTFAARYLQDNETHSAGHWEISKIKEPRGNYITYQLPCSFDHQTRIFKAQSII